jgi:hypothetical protein
MSMKLSVGSWVCFALAALMIRTPSPLLLVLVPAHFALGLAAFFPKDGRQGPLIATAVLLAANWGFLFRTAFLGG